MSDTVFRVVYVVRVVVSVLARGLADRLDPDVRVGGPR